MPSIYDLKPRFQQLLRPLNTSLVRLGVTANMVTLVTMFLSVLLGVLVALQPYSSVLLLSVPIWLFVRMAFNAIDGMLAREHNMTSRLGAVLNEMGDVISDAALYLPLALIVGIVPWLVVIIVLMAVLIEMIGVVAIQIGASRRYDGPFGKSDRAFVFGVLFLLLGLGLSPGWWSNGLLWAMLVASVLTLINRGRRALEETDVR